MASVAQIVSRALHPALWVLLAAAVPQLSASIKPMQLRCEHLMDPLGIDVDTPRLSWSLENEDQGAKIDRGIQQTAYRVLVSSSEALLKQGKADLWDSGKVQSSQNTYIEYKGQPLKSGMECYWQVGVWTKSLKDGAGSQPIIGKSPVARWSMGILEPAAWKAKWISAPGDVSVEPAPMFRKAFSVNKKIERAVVFVCGLGYHEMSINGRKVGDHVLDPKFTRYDRRVLYVTHEVTGMLKSGPNALGVVLGNGWYNYHTENPWEFHNAPWRAKPKLMLQLVIDFADGSTQTVISDESWKHSTGGLRFDGMLNGDVYDARLEKAGWDTAAFDDASWQAARLVEGPKGKPSAQMVQPIRITRVIKPIRVTQPKPGVFLYDMGQNIAGTARLTVTGPAGAEVKMRYGELLRGDGTLDQGNINSFCKSGEFQTERYTLKGGNKETWNSRFMYHGFQYVEVTGFPGEPKLESLEALVMHTDVASTGSFECSNELLNKIQQATRWSYLNNLHGYPTDCPNREKNGWTGDAHLAAEAGLYNFDASAAYTQWMLDFQDEQKPTGELPGIVPTGGWGYAWGNGPAWDSAYTLIPWYLYQYRGDSRILTLHYDNLKRYVDYLTTRAKDGIVSIGLGDWCPAATTTPVEVTSTGYYYGNALIVARIAKMLEKDDDAAKYTELAGQIKSGFNRAFLKQDTKLYANGSQTALACALHQGLVNPADMDAVMGNLVAAVESKNNHLDCGILGTKYLLRALSENRRTDVAYRIATQTTFPSWGHWIQQGATTLWENWNGQGTHNHVMFGDISAWFYDALAGIRPDPTAPGFKKIIIRPSIVGDLTWVKCHHDSMHGRIVSNWQLEGKALTMEVTIPPNTMATVFVPARSDDQVTESGKPAAKAQGVKFLRMEHGTAVYEVGSGSFRFVASTI